MKRLICLLLASSLATPALAQSGAGSATGGTSANQSILQGCRYNSSAPSLSSGQQVALQCSSGGALQIAAPAAGLQSNNYGFISSAWQPIGATLNSTTYELDIEAISGSNLATLLSSSIPAGTSVIGYISNDPCSSATKLQADFESTSSGGNLVTGTTAKITYICSIVVSVSTLTNFSLCDSATTGCTNAVFGNTGTTAGNGMALGQSATVGGGLTQGSGNGTLAKSTVTGNNVTVLFTTTNTPQVNVHVTYVQQ